MSLRITGILVLLMSLLSLEAASARIIKVLPHYLDLKGRHTLSPSLYERDAYQLELRSNMERVSTVRFDINWSSKGISKENLKIRIQVRGSETKIGQEVVIDEKDLKTKLFGSWAKIKVDEETFKKVGKLVAWRVSIWDGDTEVTSQQSFLW